VTTFFCFIQFIAYVFLVHCYHTIHGVKTTEISSDLLHTLVSTVGRLRAGPRRSFMAAMQSFVVAERMGCWTVDTPSRRR